jgi:2-methylisocitrate lyase-like PEP mutase family enzyme
MRTQAEKARRFRELHERPGIFIIPNPWDAGTAKLLASLGFEALATTSLGYAASIGRTDGTLSVSRKQLIANCREIAEATELPVSADLENGYSNDPKEAATIMQLAAEAGVVGGSVEDASGDAAKPIYDFSLAVERVAAAVEVARGLSFPFTLTARAENLLHGRPDLDDTIRRLQAYAGAGADVLYAPGLRDLNTIRQFVSALPKPLNVVMGLADPELTVAQLREAGVKRISVGGALTRLALGAVMKAAQEMKEQGSFRWLHAALPGTELKRLLER